jgi:Acetyltransferase (GNAT) family
MSGFAGEAEILTRCGREPLAANLGPCVSEKPKPAMPRQSLRSSFQLFVKALHMRSILTRAKARHWPIGWAVTKRTFVAEEDGVILGTYYMRPNQAGGGRHVCNCGYMTQGAATGSGIARAMCEHSREYARLRGYRAMQFNFVVSTNARAVRL